jgi:predicted transcriptional regulator
MSPRASKRAAPPAEPPPLHELESEVMELLWSIGEASVRSVMETLNASARKPRAYTTYMTIMARLNRKRLLARRREGRTDFYQPTLARTEYMARRARLEVERLVAHYGDAALSNFAQQMASLDPARRRALERLARLDVPAADDHGAG